MKYLSTCLTFFSKVEISIMKLIRLKSIIFPTLCLNNQIGCRFKHKESESNRMKLKVTVILYSVTRSRNCKAINDSFSQH